MLPVYSAATWRVSLLLLVLYLSAASLHAIQPREQEIQAALIEKFVRFVEWPEDDALDSESIVIGVLGDLEMYETLSRFFREHIVYEKPFTILFFPQPDAITQCHILLLSREYSKKPVEVLKGLGNSPVLTIGHGERFSSLGGVVSFIRSGDRVRFIINQGAAQESGMHISHHLLQYAQKVVGGL